MGRTFVHMGQTRTNIVIDDELMAEAMRATGTRTKREAVEEALRRVTRRAAVERLVQAAGKVDFWPGFIEEELRDRIEGGDR